ncbi:elongation factor P [Aeriscardovia aeriphila]|uniref:Elongation factor P n=1 Tax=Aeriscardovia aeriphila TaxID=218139 RepID=A0A261FB19_9BIFI|nr:elongation factor P [Aeriscardovia aeriphila]MDO5694185.1 elongation factor P [Aeriscardovia aeriphila]NYI25553.1 elongation factor P [Aeriscardovia aeriphila]OZG56298.1 elongation factor P [Aeriscardovia aeriphila]
MAQTTNDIKNGSVLNLDGQLWTVVKFQHVKPGKGPAFVRTTIKNVLSGKQVERTFNAGMKVDFETVDNRDLQYSYRDGDNFVFMDMTTYDQVMIPSALIGDQEKYLLEGTECQISFHDGTPLQVQLPASVLLKVTHTEPGLQGNRSNAGTKPATVETGAEIQVPLFITEGEVVKVDTRDGSYLGRETK